jgi:hypothetical protein
MAFCFTLFHTRDPVPSALRSEPTADAAGARNWCPQELSVRQVFSHVLDIFGKPNRKFFETLSFFAKVRDAEGFKTEDLEMGFPVSTFFLEIFLGCQKYQSLEVSVNERLLTVGTSCLNFAVLLHVNVADFSACNQVVQQETGLCKYNLEHVALPWFAMVLPTCLHFFC